LNLSIEITNSGISDNSHEGEDFLLIHVL